MIRWRVGALVVAVLAVAGCAAAGPRQVAGDAAPLTLASGAGVPSGAGTATASGGVRPATLVGFGVQVTVPVPADWTRSDFAGQARSDFRDSTGQLLLRVQVSKRTAGTLEESAADLDRSQRSALERYERIGITSVSGVLGPSVDWSFTFFRDGVTRRVIDRLSASGDAGVAVYFSAPQDRFAELKPIWDRAVGQITISRAGN
jgi:hypothetical protein